MRITMMIEHAGDGMPVRKAPGPTVPMIELEPTNSPAPMTPPIAIMLRWRCCRPWWSPPSGAAAIGPIFFLWIRCMAT